MPWADITGLARVFTGFNPDYFIEDNDDIDANLYTYPMAIEEESHSELEKSFLGFTIPAGTAGPISTDLALDFIFRDPEDVVVEEFQEEGSA